MAADPTEGAKSRRVILAAAALNTLIGFAQEWRAGRAIASLSQLVP
jgi:magnesium-transporting ATPase (P-type)